LSAFLAGSLALLPGIPALPFLALAAATGVSAWAISARRGADARKTAATEASAAAGAPVAEEPISTALQIDQIRLELGYGLLSMINADKNHRLTDQIKALRRQLASEVGFVLPAVRIQDNMQLAANAYVIRVKEIEAGRGELRPNMLLAMDPRGEEIALPGEKTVEPTFGLPAMWIAENNKEEALFRGLTVVDPATVITTHIKETIKRNAHELLGRQEVQTLLDKFKETNPKVVEELVPNLMTLGKVQKVLQNLLREQISIRDLRTILETLADYAPKVEDPDVLTEYVRQALARSITKQYLAKDGTLSVMTLDRGVEDLIQQSIQKTELTSYLALEPTVAEKILAKIREAAEAVTPMLETSPVLLASPLIRMYLRKLTERFLPDLVVLSHSEIIPNVQIRTLRVVTLNAN
ncbi:MAG: FHIPEP family type III secretion protein, partial [Nitrospinae bacterium]|nr:FHIPEP family type III secretion protein [Nitrospinota bacterium]